MLGRRGRASAANTANRTAFTVTAVRGGHAQDQRSREVRYLVSMAIRMVCIVLAVVVPGPARWLFVAGAVVLPYVAVLIANAGRESAGPAPERPGPPVPLAIEKVPVNVPTPPVMDH